MNLDSAASRLASQGVAFAPQIASARSPPRPRPRPAGRGRRPRDRRTRQQRRPQRRRRRRPRSRPLPNRRPLARLRPTPGAMDPAQNADYAAGMLSGCFHGTGETCIARSRRTMPAIPTPPAPTTQWRDGATSATPTRSSSTTPVSPDPLLLRRQFRPARKARNDETGDPQETAVAELRTLIAELGALESQAQSMPALTPPQQVAAASALPAASRRLRRASLRRRRHLTPRQL